MTREEAIELVCYGDWLNILMSELGDDDINRLAEAMCIIGSALRPVSREQVEKVWRGEWIVLNECANEGLYCKRCRKKVYRIEYANEKMESPFCPHCGAAQTDEAVEMVMKRMEALKDGKGD